MGVSFSGSLCQKLPRGLLGAAYLIVKEFVFRTFRIFLVFIHITFITSFRNTNVVVSCFRKFLGEQLSGGVEVSWNKRGGFSHCFL